MEEQGNFCGFFTCEGPRRHTPSKILSALARNLTILFLFRASLDPKSKKPFARL